MSTASVLIDIDERPYVEVELDASVEEQDGRPRLVPSDPSRWLSGLRKMLGEPVRVSLMRAKKRRSNEANNYLWGVVYKDLLIGLRAIAHEASVREGRIVACPFKNAAALHDAMKYLFLGVELVSFAGVEFERPATTTVLNSAQFSTYVSQVKAMAAERWRVYIREAGERIAV